MANSSGYGTINANGTVVIKSHDATVNRIIATNPGSSWVFSVYDAATAATAVASALRWTKTLAANDAVEINIPMQNGITVICSSGTPGTAVVTWTRAG